jgi:signal transduction histidine kinase
MRSKRDTLRTGHVPMNIPDPRDSSERVTISTLPMSAEAVSGERARPEMTELPPSWLEKLLALWSDLPVAGGDDRAVVQAVVDAVAALLPGCAVGACVVPAEDGGGDQVLVRAGVVPPGEGARSDPTRLFPAATYELVCEIEPRGSTLHLAGEDASCEDPGSPPAVLARRAAGVARRGLELARVQARAARASSDLHEMTSRMVQAEKLASLGQIAAGVVHELNNPLTSIVAYTDWLARKATARPGSEDELDRLRRIAESAGRMLRFTRDLVSYARPSSETPVMVGLHMVIEQAIAFCEHVLADARVVVERELAGELPPVLGKPEQLAQIFVNLITNAAHAMADRGGTLTVRTFHDGAAVRVEVADTGHGIQAEHLPHVFTPFFTTKTSGAGTGLGLAIVKSIVDGHDGEIRVDSDAGRGATFTVVLPARSIDR